jgi:hypothetical protein
MLILKGFDAGEPLKFCFVEYSFSLINSARECISSQRSLVNDGRATHIDHVVTVKEFTVKVLQNELPFDEAYRQLWEDSNLRRSSQMQLRPKR